ncbi:hypothetical protein [Sulfobacillus thermosulfidooxidans]|uniref:hypothetical protein n=1 Tax=Sulfobacillus thermosulfidooxidans TaxID=28034 RepID=UPI0006B48572|nr:hypothetical protein [Sulfobacillus thermosulfidooxidans]
MYNVWVEEVADLGKVPGPEIFWMARFGEWLPLKIHVLLIVGEGRTILVNTGPPLDYLDHMNSVWREELGDQAHITVQPSQHIETVLSRHGISCEQVDTIIVTPLQAYADGNIDKFPNATICLSRTGWVDLCAPRFFDPRRHMAIPDRLLQYLMFTAWPEKRVRLLKDEDYIAPGLHTIWVGTHHRSSLAVMVSTARGLVAFSDIVFYYENIERNHPLGIQESMEECRIAYQMLRDKADVVVSPYDPSTMTRFPQGVISVATE